MKIPSPVQKDTASRFAPKPKPQPSAAGSSWKGGAKSAPLRFKAVPKGTALKRSGADFAPTWRSGWDSNPRAVACKLISSQPRYDHFDTAAYSVVQACMTSIRWGLFRITDCFKKIKSFGGPFLTILLLSVGGCSGPGVQPDPGGRSLLSPPEQLERYLPLRPRS